MHKTRLMNLSLCHFSVITLEDALAAGPAMCEGIELVIFNDAPFVLNEKPSSHSCDMAAKLLMFELAHTGVLGRMRPHFASQPADALVALLSECFEAPRAGP